MEILLDLDICKNLPCDETFEISEYDNEQISKRVDFDNIHSSEIVNIGPGADLLVLLLIVDIGLRALKFGAEVNDGIDGWIGIGKKLKKLFKRNKIVSIDKEGATAMAIELIAQKEEIIKLEKIQESTINLVDVSEMITINSELNKRPHNYYIQSYRINDLDVYVIGITSTGEAKIIKHFGFNPYGISEIN